MDREPVPSGLDNPTGHVNSWMPLYDQALLVAKLVVEYNHQDVPGVDLSFGWRTGNSEEVRLVLEADYDVIADDQGNEEAHDFGLYMSVEFECDFLPEEALFYIRRHIPKMDTDNLSLIECQYMLSMMWCKDELTWQEMREYVISDSKEVQHTFTIVLDKFGRPEQSDNQDKEPVSGVETAMSDLVDYEQFELNFGSMMGSIRERRIQDRVTQAMEMLDAIEFLRPFGDLSFSRPMTAKVD